MTGEKVKVKKMAKMVAIQLDNLNQCVQAMDRVGMVRNGMGAQDIHQGNTKLLWGFLSKAMAQFLTVEEQAAKV